jgi:hypothetical protein
VVKGGSTNRRNAGSETLPRSSMKLPCIHGGARQSSLSGGEKVAEPPVEIMEGRVNRPNGKNGDKVYLLYRLGSLQCLAEDEGRAPGTEPCDSQTDQRTG